MLIIKIMIRRWVLLPIFSLLLITSSQLKAQRFLIADTSNWVNKYKYDLNLTLMPQIALRIDSTTKNSLGYTFSLGIYKSVKKWLFLGGGFSNDYRRNRNLLEGSLASSVTSFYAGGYIYLTPRRYLILGHNLVYTNGSFIFEDGYAYENSLGSSFIFGLNFDKNIKYKKTKLDRFSIQITTSLFKGYLSDFFQSDSKYEFADNDGRYIPNFMYVITYHI